MELYFQADGPGAWLADVAVLFLAQGEKPEQAVPELSTTINWLSTSPGIHDFYGKQGESMLLYGPTGNALSRILLVGLGSLQGLTAGERLDRVREAAGIAAVCCRKLHLETFGIVATSLFRLHEDAGRVVEESVCAAMLALWRNNKFKSTNDAEDLPDPRQLIILITEATIPDAVRTAAHKGLSGALGVILARNLANTPANFLKPEDMAHEAENLAQRHNMICEFFDQDVIIKLGMGAFAAVAAGSVNEPRLIILEHSPAGHEHEIPLVVVGKGITFDSGGICIKPAAGMWEMKGDMGGAAAVLGLFEALGQLSVPRRVIGLMACAENMPGARAVRPGDVVTTYAGKRVEIVNTDAEGRLILCDTLAYAQQRWTPALIVDVATLTGACVVALGDDVAGIFCQNAVLSQQIQQIGELVGEPYWPLPLQKRYFENLKSETADFANSGPRAGGACSAAAFLQQFIQPTTTWAHLDIAGPAFVTRAITNCPAGATGFAVRTLLELALAEAGPALPVQ